jgi:hypothetical protein
VAPQHRLTSTACAAALAAVALLLAGCGSSSDPTDAVTKAARKTLALPDASYSVTFDGDRLFGPANTLLGGRARYDLADGIGYEALKLQAKDGTSQTLYLDILPASLAVEPWPTPAGTLPNGKLWIVAPVGRTPTEAQRRLAGQVGALTPELPLAEAAWGATRVERVGTRTVAHIPMTEYRVTVDPAKALAAARRANRPLLAAAIAEEARRADGHPIQVSLWVNGPGYVSQIEHAVPGSGLGTSTVAFSNYAGGGFQKSRPPAAQSVLLSALPQRSSSIWEIATGAAPAN